MWFVKYYVVSCPDDDALSISITMMMMMMMIMMIMIMIMIMMMMMMMMVRMTMTMTMMMRTMMIPPVAVSFVSVTNFGPFSYPQQHQRQHQRQHQHQRQPTTTTTTTTKPRQNPMMFWEERFGARNVSISICQYGDRKSRTTKTMCCLSNK